MKTKNYLYIIFLFVLTACGQKKAKNIENDLNIIVNETNEPLILRYNKKNNTIAMVMFPYNIMIYNNTDAKHIIERCYYLYRRKNGRGEGKAGGLLHYKTDKNLYSFIEYSEKKLIKKNDSLDYLLYSLHTLKEKNIEQQQALGVYKEEMRAQQKDTMHVGSLEEFRKKHPKLTEYFLESDLIRVDYRKENSDKTRRFDTNVLTKEQKEIKLKY